VIDERPMIPVAAGELAETIDEVARQLACIDEVYRCNGELVMPCWIVNTTNRRQTRKLTLQHLPYSGFRVALERTFKFVAVEFDGRTWQVRRTIGVPPPVARAIYENPRYWTNIPRISGIADVRDRVTA